MKIPDRDSGKYGKVVTNYKQIRRKLKKLDDAYIDATDDKVVLKEIRDVLIDIRQLFKLENGIQRDDDIDT